MTDRPGDHSSGPPRWLVITLAVVAAAAVAFAIGRFTTFGGAASVANPRTDSAEAGFARDMQVHHAQAIDMAMTIYRKTSDPGVRAIAYDIATTQSAQKGEFYDWLLKWGLPQSGGTLMAWMAASDEHAHAGATQPGVTEEQLMEEMGMATSEELGELAELDGTAADCLFLELMIRHHEGALPMAEALLDLGSEGRALQVAQGVIDTQSAEIDAMTSMQLQLGCR